MNNKPFKILLNNSACISSSRCCKLLEKMNMLVTLCDLTGNELLHRLYDEDYDAVVTDVFISGIDAIRLSQLYFSNRSYPTSFYGLLHSNNPSIEKAIIAANFSYYFVNPNDEQFVCNTISEQLTDFSGNFCSDMNNEQLVGLMLKDLNFSAELVGHTYLREAVLIYSNTADVSPSVTKVIYPLIAKMYNTTCCCVEKTIRLSIDIAWKAGNPIYQKKYFGYCKDDANVKRPTNLKFIATISNNLLLHEKEHSRLLDMTIFKQNSYV